MKRIQRAHNKVMPDSTFYIGHPTIFGNPFRDKKADPQLLVDRYLKWVAGELDGAYPDLRIRREALVRRINILRMYDNLSCWCGEGAPCHGDILIQILDRFTLTDNLLRELPEYFNSRSH